MKGITVSIIRHEERETHRWRDLEGGREGWREISMERSHERQRRMERDIDGEIS